MTTLLQRDTMKNQKCKSPLIVVTGAAGMIGSCVLRKLNDLGFGDLIAVDDPDGTDKWKNLLGKDFIDLIPPSELFSFLKGREKEIRAIIHLGACSDTLEKNGVFLMENNYRYTVRLADYALENDIRFIYASSAATYGDGALGFSDDHERLSELRPLNLYGFSKHLFDLWAKKQRVLDKIVGLKYFNVFGPNENHKAHMASMVYKMYPNVRDQGVLRLFESSRPDLFKDGESCRDFIYVKDAVSLTCEFLQNDLGGIFNIGLGKPVTWNALADAVFHAAGVPTRIEYIPIPEDLKKQYQNYTCADMTKLTEARKRLGLGAMYEYGIKESVRDYVTHYLAKDSRW